ncbi:hypothetical protein HDV04_003288 [Boothiomyces sp. JEL0838]|nr:hypothetical protein HDV04_003266 [Boothiomyces sp. JEL0838]KAJ3312267.1 hypothetical protein HDV04_003288 [Boothiomyces sp. JEL0838]
MDTLIPVLGLFKPRKKIHATAKYVKKIAVEKKVSEGDKSPTDSDKSHESNTSHTLTDKGKPLSEITVDELIKEADENAILLPPITHRLPVINRGLALMKRVLPLKEWQAMSEKDGVNISSLPINGLALPFIRGDGVINGNFTLQEVLSVINNAYARKTWDARFDSSQVLEFLDQTDLVVYNVQKGTFPVSARELVTAITVVDDGDSLTYVAMSVEDEKNQAPPANGKVRAEILLAGWKLTKSSNAIIRSIQTQTPLCIAGVSNYLANYGCLPFALVGSLKPSQGIIFKSKEVSTSLYSMEYVISELKENENIEELGTLNIALPAKNFASGVNVSLSCSNPDFAYNVTSIPKAEWNGLVSDNTSHILKIKCQPINEPQSVTLKIEPGSGEKILVNNKAL